MKTRTSELSVRSLAVWLAVVHALAHVLIILAGSRSGREFWEAGWLVLVYVNTVPLALTTLVLMALSDERVDLLPEPWRSRLHGLALILPILVGLMPVVIWMRVLGR